MQLGPYRIDGELGQGGSGIVYRATTATGEVLALKVIPLPRDRARLEREWRIAGELARARHGFVPVIDAGVHGDRAWMAMPLLTGGTLRERLERGPLPCAEVERIGAALAGALAAAHAREVVHRDVKPENVLFTGDGQPLLADLGVAKHFASASERSRALSLPGELRGTPLYAAPEQATDGSQVGPPADVYALGATLYECLCGQPPIETGSLLELLARKARGAFRPLRQLRPETPPALAAVIERALAGDPEQRFPDAGAFAAALKGEGPAAPGSRRPLLLAGIGLALAALLLAGALWRTPSQGPAVAPAPAAPDWAAELRTLDDPRAGVAERRAALERLLPGEGAGAAIAAAVSRSPAAPGPRLARLALEAAGAGPVRLDDLDLARTLVDPALLGRLQDQAWTEGVAGQGQAGGTGLLAGLAHLAAGRRDEALQALSELGADPRAAWCRRLIATVDEFARVHDTPAAPLDRAARQVADAIGSPVHPPLASSLVDAALAPLTARMRPLALLQLQPLRPRDVYEAAQTAARERGGRALPDFHAALFPVWDELPPRAWATYELACGDWRRSPAQAERVVSPPLDRLLARMEEVVPALRDDALLANALELQRLDLAMRFRRLGPNWDDELTARAHEMAGRMVAKQRLQALDLVVAARWGAALEPRPRPGSLERLLQARDELIAACRPLGAVEQEAVARFRTVGPLFRHDRLDEAARELLALPPLYRAVLGCELTRRRGQSALALEQADRLLATTPLAEWLEPPVRATAILALVDLGRVDEAAPHLARLELLLPNPYVQTSIGLTRREVEQRVAARR